jgi:hypothetical protein
MAMFFTTEWQAAAEYAARAEMSTTARMTLAPIAARLKIIRSPSFRLLSRFNPRRVSRRAENTNLKRLAQTPRC